MTCYLSIQFYCRHLRLILVKLKKLHSNNQAILFELVCSFIEEIYKDEIALELFPKALDFYP